MAAGLQADEATLYRNEGQLCALLTLSWKHAWRNERNHDGAWLFFKTKSPEGSYRHAWLASKGHQVVDELVEWPASLTMEVSEDGAGALVFPGKEFRGEVNATVNVCLQERQPIENLQVYGLEMVFIPGGPNKLGNPGSVALSAGAFYLAGSNSNYGGLFELTHEDQEIPVGPSAGALYYSPAASTGDGKGPIPASFPKGVAPFWIMKYELAVGQYVDFLNALSPDQARNRSPIETSGAQEAPYFSHLGEKSRESIRFSGGRRVALYPEQPCGFLGWKDLLAYADWAGLRPMTELEYTKTCRGTREPIAGGYPWGAATRIYLQRGLDENGFLYNGRFLFEGQLDHHIRSLSIFGASYYWVMDLSGSLWEWAVSIGHPEGRAFTGQHGDGQLAHTGEANTSGWPMDNGFGFRGSGYYLQDDPLKIRTYTPIAERPFACLNDGRRRRWAGGRLVRSWQ